MSGRTALVVGATKGLGLAQVAHYLGEGWIVIATTIEPSEGLDRLKADHGDRLDIRPLDIADAAAVAALRASLGDRVIDVLHIVAGVFQAAFDPVWDLPGEEVLRVLTTNSFSGIRMAALFEGLVPAGGAFAFTSSGMGSMVRNDKGGVDLYRISKASLNMLARSFAASHAGSGRAVLLLCPGWAKTDMGGADATVEVSESVAGMYAVIVGADRDAGEAQFFEYSGAVVPW